MNVTITTDASYKHTHRKGAYAFWITSEERKIQKSGVLRGFCENSQVAEIKCILNAMIFMQRARFTDKITHITINTDCMAAVDLLCRMTHDQLVVACSKPNSTFTFLPEAWRSIKSSLNCRIVLKHVKAHKGKDTPRKFVNDWCDKEAKRQLNEFLKSEKVCY